MTNSDMTFNPRYVELHSRQEGEIAGLRGFYTESSCDRISILSAEDIQEPLEITTLTGEQLTPEGVAWARAYHVAGVRMIHNIDGKLIRVDIL